MRRVLRSVALAAAAVGLALAVALAGPAKPAAAFSLSNSVTQLVSTGTDALPGFPLTPASVLSTVREAGSAISRFASQLLWGGDKSTLQGVQVDGYNKQIVTPPVDPSAAPELDAYAHRVTHTTYGYGLPATCRIAYTMGAGSWGTSVPLTRTTTEPGGSDIGVTLDDCKRYNPANATLMCYHADTGLMEYFGYGTGGGPLINGSSGATAGCPVGTIPVAWSMPPSPAGNRDLGGTDGGSWINPGYEDVVGRLVQIHHEKKCQAVGGTAITTVAADGPAGTGTTPGVMCPANTYEIQDTSWSWIPGGNNQRFRQPLYDTSIAANAASSYPDCIGGAMMLSNPCQLTVSVDGTRCGYQIPGCDSWYGIGATSPDRISCKWGNYLMPQDDCSILENCYGVPIDSLSTSPGSATGCAINPNGNSESKPVGAGKDSGGTWLCDGSAKAASHGCPSQGGQVAAPSPTATPTSDGGSGSDPSGNPTIKVTVNVSPTINVNVSPTVVVNVPQPTVNVTVQNNGPGNSTIPQGKDGSDCWTSDTVSYNPLDWAYTPMHCAMSKLFQPSPGMANQLADSFTFGDPDPAGGVGEWTDTVSSYVSAFTITPGDCRGPAMVLGKPFNYTMYPANACDEPAASIAGVCRIGSAAVLIVGGFTAGLAAILDGFGYTLRIGRSAWRGTGDPTPVKGNLE